MEAENWENVFHNTIAEFTKNAEWRIFLLSRMDEGKGKVFLEIPSRARPIFLDVRGWHHFPKRLTSADRRNWPTELNISPHRPLRSLQLAQKTFSNFPYLSDYWPFGFMK